MAVAGLSGGEGSGKAVAKSRLAPQLRGCRVWFIQHSAFGIAQRSIMNTGKRTTEHTDHTEKKPINHFVSVYSVHSVVGHSLAESLRGKRTTEHTDRTEKKPINHFVSVYSVHSVVS